MLVEQQQQQEEEEEEEKEEIFFFATICAGTHMATVVHSLSSPGRGIELRQ
jgi:hypothetical protein